MPHTGLVVHAKPWLCTKNANDQIVGQYCGPWIWHPLSDNQKKLKFSKSLVSLVITTSCQQSTFYIGAPHMNSGRTARATAPTHAADHMPTAMESQVPTDVVMAHTSPAQKAHRLATTKVLQHVHGKNVNRKIWSNFLHVPETIPKNIANNQVEKK